MTRDTDGLPDSDDPYVVLGVSPEADARTLKRAHARLIRKFRPDRDPENFKRVQAAYELAQRWAKIKKRFAPPATPKRGAHRPTTEPETGSETEADEQAVDAAAESTTGRDATAETAAPPRTWPAKPPASRMISQVEWLAEGIRRGARFDADSIRGLGSKALESLATQPGLRWAMLAKLPQREFALRLHALRIEMTLVEGRTEAALREVDALGSHLLDEPRLETEVWRVAAFAAWRYDPEAERLVKSLSSTLDLSFEDERLARAFEDIRRASSQWVRVRRGQVPSALVRFVELSRVVTPARQARLLGELLESFGEQPGPHQRCIVAMSDGAPAVGADCPEALAFFWESLALASPHGVPTYDVLDGSERAAMHAALDELERDRARHEAPAFERRAHWLAILASVALGAAVRPLVGALVYVSLRSALAYDARFQSHGDHELRERLLRLACEGQLLPGALAAHLEAYPSHFERMREHIEGLQNDSALQTLSLLGWLAAHARRPSRSR